jgi:hypothetical protein
MAKSKSKSKSKTSGNTSDKENEGDCCSWTLDDDKILLDVLREQKVAGNQSKSGWKPQVWTAVAQALKNHGRQGGGEKTSSKCQDHFSNVCFMYFLRNGLYLCSPHV